MDIDRTAPNEREPRSRRGTSKSEHVKRFLLGGLLTATTLAGGLAFTSEVLAEQPDPEQPDPEHTVWSATPRLGWGN